MKHLILLFNFSVLLFYQVHSQTGREVLKSKLLHADTVLMVSHEATAGIKLVNEETGKEVPLPKLTIHNKPNYKIIDQSKIISGKSLDSLIEILMMPVPNKSVPIGNCFMPHHAILIIKNGKTSFFDICFGCLQYITTGDIKFNELFDEQKWDKLEDFFAKEGFTELNRLVE